MSSSAREQTTVRPPQVPRTVRVVNWPLRDGGVRAWAMVLSIALLSAGAGVLAQSRIMGGLCFAALAIAAWRLWIPVAFEFRSRGLIYSILARTRQIPWTQIARYEVRKRGIVFYAEDDQSPLAALRSVYVQWNGQQAAIMEVINFYSTAQVSVASTKTFLDDTIEKPEN